MRTLRPNLMFVGLLLCSSPVASQQKFEIWPNVTPFATRGSVGPQSGVTMQGFHSNVHRGLGDTAGKCEISGFTAVLQDQNATTKETYDLVVRHGTNQAGPTRVAADLVGKIWGLQTPQGVGTQAWVVTHIFAKPMTLRNCSTHFSAGVAFPASTGLPNDGMLSHACAAGHQFSHSRQEDHAWDFIGTATVANHPSHKRTYRYGLYLPNVVMQLGNGGTRYGMGGMFPKVGESFTVRLDGGATRNNAPAVVVLSTKQFRLAGFQFGQGARLYLSPSYKFFLTSTDANGKAEMTILPSVPSAIAGLGAFHLQAAVEKHSALYLTNCQTVIP